MTSARRVRNVRYRTLGSNTTLLDEWQVPGVLYHGGRGVAWCARHWRISGPVAFLLVVWGYAGPAAAVTLAMLGAAGGLTGWLRWRRAAAGGAGSSRVTVDELKLRRRLSRQWGLACRAAKLLGPEDREPPAISHVRGDGYGTLTADMRCGDVGIPVSDVERAAGVLAEVIGCREVVCTRTGPGAARLVFHWRDPIGRALPLADVPPVPAATPPRLVYGIRQDGSPATVVATQSVLIGGLTRKGKSNWVWATLASCIIQGIPVDLYVSDPKGGVELDQLEAAMLEGLAAMSGTDLKRVTGLVHIRAYAKTAKETIDMCDAAEKGMHARQKWMKDNKVRAIVPSMENPLVVVILDETLPLTDILKRGTDSSLGRIAYTGAAAAYVVWANSQVAQIDALGRFRDLVPQRVCFATPNPQVTDAVLGPGSEARGASCSSITEAGVGFSHSEGDKVARKFRAAMVTDAATELIARGQLPVEVVNRSREAYAEAAEVDAGAGKSRKDRPTALYRHFYIGDPEYGDSLGYVGISYNPAAREGQHAAGLRAFMNTGNRRVETQWFPTRAEALAAEELAIQTEKPIWNRQHNGGNPRRRLDGFKRGRGKAA